MKNNRNIYAILHNIRSLHNVGSLFRTADAAGVTKIYLTGYTPSPTDRFGAVRREITKTALGAEHTVGWEKKQRISDVFRILKKESVMIYAVEQDARAADYKGVKSKYSFALVLGNEVSGLSKSVLEKCDKIVEIPMRGKKESLNVSVAFGIVLFSFLG